MKFIEKYAALGGGTTGGLTLAESLYHVVSQAQNANSTDILNAQIGAEGRFAGRASGERKPRAPKIEVLEGETVYLRPNGQEYHSRMWGIHSDVEAFRKARAVTEQSVQSGKGQPMFILTYGAPGCGKTALVEAAFGTDVITLMGTGDTEVADLVGGYIQTPAGGFEWVDGGLVQAAEQGKVYFIDEIGLIDPKVLSVVYGLMDGRRELVVTANPERGTVKAHPNFYVVAATNPNAPGVRLSEALLSRFTLQMEMTTDWNLARTLDVPTTVVTAAQNLAKKLDTGEVRWAPQMRELLAFRDIANQFGEDWALANLVASAPEIDRNLVADVLSRAFGRTVTAARI